MRRILLIVLRMFGPFFVLRLMWNAKHLSKEENFEYLQKSAKRAIKVGRVIPHYYGIENIPKEPGFVYFPNHQGMFDVMMFLASSPHPFSFVMKKELANVPLLKQVAECSGSLAMDRENMRQSLGVIQEMAKRVSNKENFLIFAEGTRNRNKNIMGNMKPGAFKCAVRAHAPIVPCVLIDSYLPFDTKLLRKVHVEVHYLPPIYYEEYQDMKTVDIAAMVQERITRKIEEVENARKCENGIDK